MDVITQSILFGTLVAILVEFMFFGRIPFSTFRFFIMTITYAVAFAVLYTLFSPFSMQIA